MQSLSLALLMVLIACPIGTTFYDDSLQSLRLVMERWSLSKVEMSAKSRDQFKEYMETFCMVKLTKAEFLNKYLQWERVEFFRGVRRFLDPSENRYLDLPFDSHNYVQHDFKSNCTHRNLTKIRRKHDDLKSDHDFENYLYDLSFGPGLHDIGLSSPF